MAARRQQIRGRAADYEIVRTTAGSSPGECRGERMPTFLETLGFVVYLSVMYGGMPDRELLASAYSGASDDELPGYRGVRSLSRVDNSTQVDDAPSLGEAVA